MKEVTKSWIEFAIRDFKAADELRDDESLTNIVLFHLQQTVEKYFKAILEEYEIKIPRVHSIILLYEKIPSELKSKINITDSELNLLDDIYINERYPSELGILPEGFPTKQRANDIYILVERIVSEITKIFK
ncbi:MAG: HEPN domain-containing protein [Ignavibacteria bacterium]|nr:HEPN domain-containing protein [Ignavibacteria bacterium]